MSARLTARGWGVLAVVVAAAGFGLALGYPEGLGLATGALLLLIVSFFLVSGGGPAFAVATALPRVERLSDTVVRVDVDAARAHRRGLRAPHPRLGLSMAAFPFQGASAPSE